MRAFAVQVAGLKSSFHAGVPRTKLLAETKGCGLREAAHCTRGAVRLSTLNATRSAVRSTIRARSNGCG
jgi:hypothetical protein